MHLRPVRRNEDIVGDEVGLGDVQRDVQDDI